MDKMKSMAYMSPSSSSRLTSFSERAKLYREEKEAIREDFRGFEVTDWMDPAIQKRLGAFSRKVITVTTDNVNQNDLVSEVLPTETVEPGDTYVKHEISGPRVFEGSYGAAVRMSRPQINQWTATTNPKHVGLKLVLNQIQRGKYSPSELGEYVGNLITAYKNRALFVNTLAGMTTYSSGGTQYTNGVSVSIATMISAYNTLTDEAEIKMIIGRRNAILNLSNNSNWSNETKREFESKGMIGMFGGVPVFKVNSFTDADYGYIYPFPKTDLWVVSELPAGVYVQAGPVQSSSETVIKNQTLNMYYWFDDGYGIFHEDRLGRIVSS